MLTVKCKRCELVQYEAPRCRRCHAEFVPEAALTFADAERLAIQRAMPQARNVTELARILGISVDTAYKRLKAYGIEHSYKRKRPARMRNTHGRFTKQQGEAL